MRSKQHVELKVVTQARGDKEIITPNISIGDIADAMKALDWQSFQMIVLSRAESDWVSVSGSLGVDGLACVYQKENTVYLREECPYTVDDMIWILESYFKGDDKFKLGNTFTVLHRDWQLKRVSPQEYKAWEADYKIRRKSEKATTIKRAVIGLAFACAVAYSIFLGVNGELKFIGQPTSECFAAVMKTDFRHVGHGNYVQEVYYEFEYEGATYTGEFDVWLMQYKQEAGRRIKIKFSTGNPELSKYLGQYK